MDNDILFNVFIFLAAACIVVPIASRFKLGSVLGYLAAGILIGPFGLGLIGESEKIMHFAEFGVVMMLFIIGLELEPAALWRLRKSILGLGGLQMILTSAAFTGIGLALGFDWQISLVAGLALALSSTALVLQMLQERNLMNTLVGETSFSVLLFQDIAVIPILILLPLLAANSGHVEAHASLISGLPGWAQGLSIAGVIAAVIATGRYLSSYLFHVVAKTKQREIFTATSLAIIIGITLLMQLIGISPALGAFVAGIVLANSEYRHTLEADIDPFKGLLLGLFFISIGMGMDFGLFAKQPIALLGAVAGLMAVKATVLYFLGRKFGLTDLYTIGFAFALSQGGEFAFVLFQFAGLLDILPKAQSEFLTLVVAMSIAATPLLMLFFNRYIRPRYMSILPERMYDRINENQPVIIAGFGRFGQVVGRFMMAQGIKVTVLEKDPDQVDSIRKFNFKSYFGDAARLDLLRSAGAAKAKLLVVAVDKPDECLTIVKLAKKEFPNLTIYARARNRRHAYELSKAGVHHYQRETFDASLEMAKKAMVLLGKTPADMDHRAQQFKQHDEASLEASFAFFDNEPEMINFTKTQTAELERILQGDALEEGVVIPFAERA